jgi:N-methylhydantoinase A
VLEELNHTFEKMKDEATESVEIWGGRKVEPRFDRFVDLRYEGQASEISILAPDGNLGPAQLTALADAFEKEHEKTYGHSLPGTPLRLVNLRLVATIPTKRVLARTGIDIKTGSAPVKQTGGMRKAYWGKDYGSLDTPVFDFGEVRQSPIEGPVLIDCYDTTIVVPPDYNVAAGDWGNIVINIKKEVD